MQTCSQLSEVDLLPYVCLASVLAFLCAVGIGANDLAANFAMVVGSGSLSLQRAVRYCAFFEMLGAAVMGGEVSRTITRGIVSDSLIWQPDTAVTVAGMVAASFAAALWLFLSSYYGLPVSITHTVVGSMIGFALFAGGPADVQAATIVKIVVSWVVAPVGAALATMLFATGLRRVMLTRGQFLDQLRAEDAAERAAAGEARYRPVFSPQHGATAAARQRSPRMRHGAHQRSRPLRSFGAAALQHLYRYIPALILVTLAVNACFVLLEQPAPIRLVQPIGAQAALVAVITMAAAYLLYALWMPGVRRAAEEYRGPFPWQFEVLRFIRERRSGGASLHSTARSTSLPHTEDEPTLRSGAVSSQPEPGVPLPSAAVAVSSQVVDPSAGLDVGGSFSEVLHRGEDEAHPHPLLRDPSPFSVARSNDEVPVHSAVAEVLSGDESSSSSSSSDHRPEAHVGMVSFTLGRPNGSGPQVRRRVLPRGSPSGLRRSNDLANGVESSTSSDTQQPSDGPQNHLEEALGDAAGLWRNSAGGAMALVPVRRHHKVTAALESMLPALSPHDTSLRAEYLFTALQLIAGAMSSFVHGAVAGANATGPFIVLYNVFMDRMMQDGVERRDDYSTAFANVIAMVGIAVGMTVLGARLVATVGSKLIVVTPAKGYAMQVGGTFVTMLCTAVGIPVSLSQCQVGAAVGSGLLDERRAADVGRKASGAVNWKLVTKLIAGWVLTLVASATTCGIAMHLLLHVMCGGHIMKN